jgi:hypothetical protein
MLSKIKPGFVYKDVGSGITENDLDAMADTWDMDGREVYRGTRDPRYTHANVHWLYDDNLERVGCVEHDLKDHARFHILWFHDTEFGTFLQEDGWDETNDLWSHLPRHVFDRFINEQWSTPHKVLEQCLNGPVRIVTPSMLADMPVVHTCQECGRKSLEAKRGCVTIASPLDFPVKEKVFFVDDDLVVFSCSTSSRVWSLLTPQPHGGDWSSQEPAQASAQSASPQTEQTPPPPRESHPADHSPSPAESPQDQP